MPTAALDTSSSSTGILPSNISRQAIVFHSTVGLPKCQVMEKMVLAINPGCDVTTLQAFIPKDSLGEMLSQFPRPDYIVDAIDIVPQKLVLAKWCRKQRIPLLSSMGGTDKLDPSCLQFAQIKKTSGNRLAKAMRKEGRKHSIKELEVLYSTERGAGSKPPKTEDGKRPEKGQTDFGHHELHTADHGPDDCRQGHLPACRIRARALHGRGRSAMLGPEQPASSEILRHALLYRLPPGRSSRLPRCVRYAWSGLPFLHCGTQLRAGKTGRMRL